MSSKKSSGSSYRNAWSIFALWLTISGRQLFEAGLDARTQEKRSCHRFQWQLPVNTRTRARAFAVRASIHQEWRLRSGILTSKRHSRCKCCHRCRYTWCPLRLSSLRPSECILQGKREYNLRCLRKHLQRSCRPFTSPFSAR